MTCVNTPFSNPRLRIGQGWGWNKWSQFAGSDFVFTKMPLIFNGGTMILLAHLTSLSTCPSVDLRVVVKGATICPY